MDNLTITGVGRGRWICESGDARVGELYFETIYCPNEYKYPKFVDVCICDIGNIENLRPFFKKYYSTFCENGYFYFKHGKEKWEKFFNKKSISRNIRNEKIYRIKVDKP